MEAPPPKKSKVSGEAPKKGSKSATPAPSNDGSLRLSKKVYILSPVALKSCPRDSNVFALEWRLDALLPYFKAYATLGPLCLLPISLFSGPKPEEQGQHKWDYYIHFDGLNRRTDSWKKFDELRPVTDPECWVGFLVHICPEPVFL